MIIISRNPKDRLIGGLGALEGTRQAGSPSNSCNILVDKYEKCEIYKNPVCSAVRFLMLSNGLVTLFKRQVDAKTAPMTDF
jgi:hypothetical protein